MTSNQLPLAAAMLFVLAISCMCSPLEELWNLGPARSDASLASDKIHRYIDQIPEVGQTVGAKFLQPLSQSLRFEGVSYATSGKRKLLDRFDLKVPAGSVTALVALDPLEALAAAYLLPRFIEPHSGRVLVDGEDVSLATLESLRAETIFVGGNDPFLTGSVLENISCGSSEYSLQKVTEAAKAAHAHHFILKLSEGYETILGEHGESLTPGQGFRLGLARANLRTPALLIIEEPTATLDEDTKSMLDDAYTRLKHDRTVLFLPTRLSTARKAEQIVVLHRGKVAAVGTHAELVKSSAEYRHWEYMKFNEFQRDRETETS